MNKIILGFFLICNILVITSCDPYQKVLKSTDYEFKLVKAKEYYNEGEYSRAIPLFEELISVYKGTKSLEKIYYFYSYALFGQKDYLLAEFYFKNFHTYYPKSIYAQDALFMVAYCNYQLSPKAKLDQTYSRKAIDQFQLFINTYPGSEQVKEANDLVEEIRAKMEEKSFEAAKMYYHQEKYRAASVAFENMLKEFPDTEYDEEATFLVLKSNFLYAENSIDSKKEERYRKTIDIYYDFSNRYQESKWIKDAEKIFAESENYLSKIKV